MSVVRPDIYVDVELRGTRVHPRVIIMLVAVLLVVILVVVLVYFLCRFFVRAQYSQQKRVNADSTNVGGRRSFQLNCDDTDIWKRTFFGIVCDNKKYVHNAAALHAVYCVPLDLRLCDPLSNDELFMDKNCFSRACERRRMLNDVFGTFVHDVRRSSNAETVSPGPKCREASATLQSGPKSQLINKI
ncbi:hypothetical protein TcCL_NonESM02201 [Trypanosoma cruzi]|uniref:Uncharacterized protein n=1 Tax=Trypanosoma cruzi (strain CL Brener) TaxID=353153 RepID=Q4CNH3_TRYCC|nr:hypothetical protein Tc00.1047053507763.20 [Trypanosoma cruzi]EAN81825.1 hypothetical protein Tc00.1047053507763.20 [Trypanosoma cruzi]RNC47931.1 hypothetical protein TcCL_NonESM02201 [Trypanosoma cruzi]|eukprot:XP_803271.1 hypothetical protein [Trypanosoma cruzi strain CL Brener]